VPQSSMYFVYVFALSLCAMVVGGWVGVLLCVCASGITYYALATIKLIVASFIDAIQNRDKRLLSYLPSGK